MFEDEDLEELEGEVGLLNESGLPNEVIIEALKERREFARVERWVDSWKGSSRRRNSTPFNQDKYSIPENIYDQFRVAAEAAKYDDVVSNAVEVTEQLAFKRLGIECGDDDLNNIAKQILDQLDLTQRMREIWRELFTISQCYVAVQWGRKEFKVKGTQPSGRPPKKKYKLLVPTGMSTLDPLKIIPVGNFLFGNEQLVYIADDMYEARQIENSLVGLNSSDLIVKSLFVGPYVPANEFELADLADLIGRDIDLANRLFVLNPENVWRITSSRPSYQRFADVRMTSVFELLDLKHNLRESDRSDILGNLNCIVLVKKGDDKKPATDQELQGVASQMRSNSRNSLMITDHRIDIEILTKKTDHTLQPERHNALDSRITARLFQILQTGNYAAGTAVDDSSKLFKVIAASMEARRDNIRDSVMDKVIEKVWEKNDELKGDPVMTFYPRRIALDFDPNYSELIWNLFQADFISQQTMLDELDIDLEQEAYRVEREKKLYKDIFGTRLMPGQGPAGAVPGAGGGNANGGGQNPASGKPSPSNEPNSTRKSDVKKSKAELEDEQLPEDEQE